MEACDLNLLEHMLWSVPEERSIIEEVVTAVVAPKLHAALEIARQADDVHSKALQAWFNPDEERAAILEAHAKLLRLTRRLEDIRSEPDEGASAPRLRQLGRRIASHLDDVAARKEQLAGEGSGSAGKREAEVGAEGRSRGA